MNWVEAFAFVVGVLLLPALALAGWRAGKQGRAETPPRRRLKAENLGLGEVRPRVRSATYSRPRGRGNIEPKG